MRKIPALAILVFLLQQGSTQAAAGPKRLVGRFRSAGLAPEDIAYDSSDGTYWVTSYLEPTLFHYDSSWRLLDTIASPFPGTTAVTGIAYNSARDTLLVINPVTAEVVEIRKNGEPTGFFLQLDLDPVVNPRGIPFVRSLAYVPESDVTDSALLVYESVGAKIYCFNLETGERIFSFVHPDDPDGYPGHGAGVSGGGLIPVLDQSGALRGVELTGRQGNEYVIRFVSVEVDFGGGDPEFRTEYSGRYIPLTGLSGKAAGFERGTMRDPNSGELIDVFYVAVDTRHEIWAFRTDPLPLYKPFDCNCADEADDVTITWRNADSYDRIVISRNGKQVAVLPGDATSYNDTGLGPGTYNYRMWAEADGLATEPFSCTRFIGPGQVLLRRELPGNSAGDMAIGPDGLLWITDPGLLAILRYDPANDAFEDALLMPFSPPAGEDFWPSLIAVDPAGSKVYILEIAAMELYTFSSDLTQLGDPVKIELPKEEEDQEFYPTSLIFDPQAGSGQGGFFLLEGETARIYELDRRGNVLRSFRHPDWDREPPPPDSPLGPSVFGMAAVPGSPGLLDLTGGALWDRGATRILRVNKSDGVPTGWEMPFDGLDVWSWPGATAILWYGERLFALNVLELRGVLYELRTGIPDPPPPSELTCRQESLEDHVTIAFRNNGPYQYVTIERNGIEIARLSGDATGFEDLGTPPGNHTYTVRAFAGGRSLPPVSCKLRVGVGAALDHTVIWPPRGVGSVARDPLDGTYYMTSRAYKERDKIFHIDHSGALLEEIPSPYEGSWQIATLAVSPREGGGRLITTIGWYIGGTLDETHPLLLTHQSETGDILWGPEAFETPVKPPAPFVLYPASLHWDGEGGFWFLERNAGIMWHIDSEAHFLESFPHPAPPADQFVFATAVAFVPERGVFYFSTDSPEVSAVTRLVESTINGTLTGYELSLDGSGLTAFQAVVFEGKTFRVFGTRYAMPAFVTCKAFDDGPAVLHLAASQADRAIELTWEVEESADTVRVKRNGVTVAELPGNARSYTDTEAPPGEKVLYVVSASKTGKEGPHAASTVFVPGQSVPFIRGDANGSGNLNIADAIYILGYLFGGGPEPACLDAADADDDGKVRINDVIYLLGFLFAESPQPPPPFPEPGPDPTPDGLPCAGL